jgi:hypothetical protein
LDAEVGLVADPGVGVEEATAAAVVVDRVERFSGVFTVLGDFAAFATAVVAVFFTIVVCVDEEK